METLRENATFEKCGISLDQIEFYYYFSWWIGGATSTFISVAGIILNGIAVCILCNKREAPCLFNRLLISLAVMDNLFLSTTLFDAFKDQLTKPPLPFNFAYIFVNILYPVRSISMCSSIYITVGLSFERYTFLVKPLHHRTRHNRKVFSRLLMYIISTVTFSLLYCIPKFLDLEIKEISNCEMSSANNKTWPDGETQNCTIHFDIEPTEVRQNPYYILWYINVSNLVVTGLCPGVLLAFFNYNIYTLLKQSKIQRASMIFSNRIRNECREHIENCQDNRRTFILFSIVVLFVMCHSLRVVMNIEEVTNVARDIEGSRQCPLRYWAIIIIPISSLLLQINAGTNFFIYCKFDEKFREMLLSTISKSSQTNTNTNLHRNMYEFQERVFLELKDTQ